MSGSSNEDTMPASEPSKQTAPKLIEIPINSPMVLDMLWGAFMASGDEKYIIRIISALPNVNIDIKEDHSKFMIGGTARWLLTSNAIQHEIVFKICKEQVSRQPEEISNILCEILAKASEGLKKRDS